MSLILVVEDSPTLVSVVESTLREEGYKVHVARDGLTALASVRAFVPDLILLDVLLPHVSGLDVCASIRRSAAHHDIPIVMMSGLIGEEDVRRGHEVGANAYLKKPFSKDILLGTLHDCLDHCLA